MLLGFRELFFCTVVLLAFFAVLAEAQSPGDFRVFNATQYRNAPNWADYGVEELKIIYGHFLWPNKDVKLELPSDQFLREALDQQIEGHESIICIDIEHWPLKMSNKEVQASIEKFVTVLNAARAISPEAKLGYYGVLPVREYWGAVEPSTSKKWRQWEAYNTRLMPLASSVDIVFPSVYTFYNRTEQWVTYATQQIQMARRFGKPVYVFLWPQFHESNLLIGLDYIDGNFWRLQLETVAKYADGLVIWGGWDFEHNSPAQWNEDAGWWIETKAFLTEHNISAIQKPVE